MHIDRQAYKQKMQKLFRRASHRSHELL